MSSFTKSVSLDSENISSGEKIIRESEEMSGWTDLINYLIEKEVKVRNNSEKSTQETEEEDLLDEL